MSPHHNAPNYPSSKTNTVSNENENQQDTSFIQKQDVMSSECGGGESELCLSKTLKQISPASSNNLSNPVSALSIINIQTDTPILSDTNKTHRDHIHSSISPISSSNKRPRLLMNGDDISINNNNNSNNNQSWVVSNLNS